MRVSVLILTFSTVSPFFLDGFDNKVLQDLDPMYQIILENHPGPHNQKDPDFMKNMNRAYQEVKNNSVRVNSQEEAF